MQRGHSVESGLFSSRHAIVLLISLSDCARSQSRASRYLTQLNFLVNVLYCGCCFVVLWVVLWVVVCAVVCAVVCVVVCVVWWYGDNGMYGAVR
jgi:Flp pilus assembly protein TadB